MEQRADDAAWLVQQAREGRRRPLARILSAVEDGTPLLRDVLAVLAAAPSPQAAHVVGITGAPGVGKSSLTSELIRAWRAQGRTVAVLAVDPSSPFSGGAILGDRVRMQEHANDPGVYIRSMASRGHLGGLAASTPQAARILSAIGVDIVVVETVGVGQSEVEIAAAADTTLVLVAPGMGDGIQAVKAGIAEIGDILVVNKADRDGADAAVRDLRHALSLSDVRPQDRQPGPAGVPEPWSVPIHRAVATRGEGIDTIVEAIAAHGAWLDASGERRLRAATRAREEVLGIALGMARARLAASGDVTDLADRVAGGTLDPFAAAEQLLARLTSGQDRP